MAEFVQLNVEEMLPELEQMERIGLFTRHETRKILKKRRHYEYKLRRRTKQKEDYLQYIQYEINALSLVKKRREKLGNSFKKHEIDVSIVQRIHKLFRMACSRFQDDVKLHLSHIEFSKSRKEKANVSRQFTRMLQVHNRKPDLWVLAAKWEFEDHSNTENARGLLQRGLRFNPETKHLWLEYYRLELLNADKLRIRKEVLGLENEDENEDTVSDVSEAILSGQVARVVYKKALEAFPNDVEFCLSFLPICKLFDFTDEMEQEIYDDLKTQYADSPNTWDALARQYVEKKLISTNKEGKAKERIALENQARQVYDDAVQRLNTDAMWDAYLRFSIERISLDTKKGNVREIKIKKTLLLFEKAHESNHLSEDMFQEWVTMLVNTSRVPRASEVSNLAIIRHPQSVILWKQCLQFAMRSSATENEIFCLMKKALDAVKEKASLPIYQLMIEWAIATKSIRITSLFEAGMSKKRCVSSPIKDMYVDWLALTKGIKKTRKEYDRLSKVKPVSLEFFKKFITIEHCQSTTKIEQLRRLYEDAIGEYGEMNTDLWIDYIKFELAGGDATNAGKIHWRAMKQLDGSLTESFVTQYTLLQTGHLN